jgi:HEAT repeat protein
VRVDLRVVARVLLVALALAVGGCGEREAPYRVEVDLDPSIRALASDDLEKSAAAQDRIAALGADALPALEAALRREDEATRIAVIEALAEMSDARRIPLLVRTLREDASGEVRAEAAFALRGTRRNETVEDALVAALDDAAAAVREKAAVACGSLCRGAPCIDRLTALALGDDTRAVWWAARVALARLRREGGEGHAVDAAVRAAAPARLAGSDADRADRAALLLADGGDAQGAGRLEDLVETGSDVTTRQQAVSALGEVGGATAVAALCGARRETTLAVLAAGALQRAAVRGVAGAATALETCPGPPAPKPLAARAR